LQLYVVMAGRPAKYGLNVPAIHAAPQRELSENCLLRLGVDARDKPGHDARGLCMASERVRSST